MEKSRIVVICHPNTSRVDFILTDKRFNNEKYSFSRNSKPSGNEKVLLDRCHKVFGVQRAEASKNELSIELDEGFTQKEVLPQILKLVQDFAGPDLGQHVYLDDRVETDPTRYDEDGYRNHRGTKRQNADLGFEYKVFVRD